MVPAKPKRAKRRNRFQPSSQPAKRSLSSLRKDELIIMLAQVFASMDQTERHLHTLMTDWQDHVPAHVRARVMEDLYDPLLKLMIDLGLRP
jgi:hypothetical protein